MYGATRIRIVGSTFSLKRWYHRGTGRPYRWPHDYLQLRHPRFPVSGYTPGPRVLRTRIGIVTYIRFTKYYNFHPMPN